MRKFRRKPKVVWLPTIGDFLVDASVAEETPNAYVAHSRTTQLTVPGANNTAAGLIAWTQEPVTFDNPFSGANLEFNPNYEGASLRDLVSGNEYRLRRIVGKCFLSWRPADEISGQIQAPNVEVTAGFMVRRFAEEGPGLSGANFILENPYLNVAAASATEDPWIWRRTWLLGNLDNIEGQIMAATAVDAYWPYPNTNVQYGSVADGPHIDQKTARIIKRGERLTFHLAARVLPFDTDRETPYGNAGGTVNAVWSARILASLRASAYGNRKNASR